MQWSVTGTLMKMKVMLSFCLLAVLSVPSVLSVCDSSDTATLSSERTSNGVKLKIYRVTVSEWNDVTTKFTAQVAAKASTYCESHPGACGLSTCCAAPFKENMIQTVVDPAMTLKDVEVTIALDLPTDIYNDSTGSPECVVKKAALTAIIGEARKDIHSDTGYWITYVDTDFYGIPPPTQLNQIIIPIASAVTAGIALLAVGLNMWSKKKEAEIRRQKIIEQRRKSSKQKKPTPVYNVGGDPYHVGGIDGKNQKPKRKDQLYKDNLRQSTLKAKKAESVLSEDSAIKVDTEPRQRQAFAYVAQLDGGATGKTSDIDGTPYRHLAPIENPPDADDEAKAEKKKKKKKKRSKSKENMEGMTNGTFQHTDEKDENQS